MSATPTLLKLLVVQRHWQKYDTFASQYTHAANELAVRDHDPKLRGLSIARRQFARWLAGTLKTRPYPDHCRVLEYLFGRTVEELFSAVPQASELAQAGIERASVLTTMSAVSSTPAKMIDGTRPSEQPSGPVAGAPGGWSHSDRTGLRREETARALPVAASNSRSRVRLEWGGSVTRVELPGVPWDTIVELSEVGGGLQRRVLVKVGGLLVAEALLSRIDAERFVWARLNPSRIDLRLVGDLRAVTLASVQEIHRASPIGLLASIRSHLHYLTGLLQAGPPSQVERPLRLVTGEAAVVAGWLAFLINDRAEAERCYGVARQQAHQADDDLLAAQTRIPMSYLYSPRYSSQGDPGVALRLLDEASRSARRLSAPMRGWLAACAAAEHANLGDADAARAQLDEAADALADIRPGEEQQFLALWEPTRLDSYVGLCAILLADGRQAEQALRRALKHADPALVRHRTGILIDLGVACLLQRNLDEGCDDLGEAATLAAQHGLPIVARRILGIRRQWLPQQDDLPVVQALDERLQHALAVTSRASGSSLDAGDSLIKRQA